MGIKQSNMCGMCNSADDSIEHMLLYCEISRQLWAEVNNWKVELGMLDYHLSNTRIIEGDLQNALSIKSIILLTNKVIYNAMKKGRKPHILNVKYVVKSFYYQEKYRQYINGNRTRFEQQYNLLVNLYENGVSNHLPMPIILCML